MHDACMLKCDAEGIMSLDALSMPHAMGAFVCVEPLAGGRGGVGGAPLHPPAGLRGQSHVIAGQRSPLPSLALNRSDRQRIHDRAVIAPLPRADRPGRCTVRSFADAWPPNLIQF
jgi:hypothetical protein